MKCVFFFAFNVIHYFGNDDDDDGTGTLAEGAVMG